MVVVGARVVDVVAGATVVVVVDTMVVDDVLVVVSGTVVDDVDVVDDGGATVVLVVSVETVLALAECVVVPIPADIKSTTQSAASPMRPIEVTMVMRLRRRDRSPRSIPTHRPPRGPREPRRRWNYLTRCPATPRQARTTGESVAKHLPLGRTIVVTSTL